MMKFLVIVTLIFVFNFKANSQAVVTWICVYNPTIKAIEIKATLEDGWHIYSQNIEPDAGPVATSFTFEKNKDFKLKGKVAEPISISQYDPNFEANVNYFENEVVFNQKIKVNKSTTLIGTVNYMVCNESMCLPPKDEQIKLIIQK